MASAKLLEDSDILDPDNCSIIIFYTVPANGPSSKLRIWRRYFSEVQLTRPFSKHGKWHGFFLSQWVLARVWSGYMEAKTRSIKSADCCFCFLWINVSPYYEILIVGGCGSQAGVCCLRSPNSFHYMLHSWGLSIGGDCSLKHLYGIRLRKARLIQCNDAVSSSSFLCPNANNHST